MSAKDHAAKAPATNSYKVEVRLKPGFSDAEGAQALALLQGLGLTAAREIRASRIYELRGPFNLGHVQQAARELLCDAVTQEFRVLAPGEPPLNGMTHWRVEVWLKESVTDPVGETVSSALIEMGLPAPESVRVGASYQIAGRCHKGQLEKLVSRSLANPVIHRFSVSESHP